VDVIFYIKTIYLHRYNLNYFIVDMFPYKSEVREIIKTYLIEKINTINFLKTDIDLHIETEIYTTAFLLMFLRYENQEAIWNKLRMLGNSFYIFKHKNEALKYIYTLPEYSFTRYTYGEDELLLEGKLGFENEDIARDIGHLYAMIMEYFKINMPKFDVKYNNIY